MADGMGGHLDGALGAQIVIDVARNFAQNPPDLAAYRGPLAALDQLCRMDARRHQQPVGNRPQHRGDGLARPRPGALAEHR
ncbi:MAG: hypothetical protein MZW92_47605 [Comamonadaceae bacterium]|nr:hypothetical protein [Comamonadaceae bacterium]